MDNFFHPKVPFFPFECWKILVSSWPFLTTKTRDSESPMSIQPFPSPARSLLAFYLYQKTCSCLIGSFLTKMFRITSFCDGYFCQLCVSTLLLDSSLIRFSSRKCFIFINFWEYNYTLLLTLFILFQGSCVQKISLKNCQWVKFFIKTFLPIAYAIENSYNFYWALKCSNSLLILLCFLFLAKKETRSKQRNFNKKRKN